MAEKSFQFVADTLNGEILEFPATLSFNCSDVEIIGTSIVRNYTITDCIEAKIVFLIKQGGNVFGSSQFKSKTEFQQYLNSACSCCPPSHCWLLINGCYLRINGYAICIS